MRSEEEAFPGKNAFKGTDGGLTIREYIAIKAMHGLIIKGAYDTGEQLAWNSARYADQLLKALAWNA